MENITQAEFIGSLIIALGIIISFVTIFVNYAVKRNQKDNDLVREHLKMYNQFEKSLTENTLAIKHLREYLERNERETKSILSEHEKRLDEHHDLLIKLTNTTNYNFHGDKK